MFVIRRREIACLTVFSNNNKKNSQCRRNKLNLFYRMKEGWTRDGIENNRS